MRERHRGDADERRAGEQQHAEPGAIGDASACGRPSSTSARRVKAQPATATLGTIATSASSAASTSAAAQPEPEDEPEDGGGDAGAGGREQHCHDGRVAEHRPARAQRRRARRSGGERASTSSASAASASAFQYPIGSRSRAALPPSEKRPGIALPASAHRIAGAEGGGERGHGEARRLAARRRRTGARP